MERLTTDTPSNNEETLDNYAYVENSLVKLRYADGEEGIDLADYIARCARKKEPCRDVMASDVLHGNTCGIGTECDCELAVLNIVAIQAAELREQLKAYEDTGLAPEEINRAVSIQHWEDAYKELYERDLAELKKYRDAEEQGRLLALPCKAGDTIYIPRGNNVLECIVQYFTIGDGEPSAFVSFECDWECNGCPFWSPYTNYEAGDGGCEGEYGDGLIMLDAFGKTVFLTPEAAEAKLKEMGSENE